MLDPGSQYIGAVIKTGKHWVLMPKKNPGCTDN